MKSQNAYAGNHWIKLRRSRIAHRLTQVFYLLILVSIATWSVPLIWKFLAYLFVLTCYFSDYLKDARAAKAAAADTVVLSSDRGVIATQSDAQVRKVQSFKIEHILCYYIQIYLCYEDGGHRRLYIFPDSMDAKAFHKFRCLGVRYRTIK